WYRPEQRRLNARLFWLIVLPAGLLVHTCECHNQRHVGTPELLTNDSQLLTQTELLIEDLMARDAADDSTARNRLVSILARVTQLLETERWFLQPSGITLPGSEGGPVHATLPATADIFQRARVFI